MARPQRNNVDYFPFFCEEGKKMFYLEETYGNDGFATFIKILRELGRTDYHFLDLSKKTTLMFLSAKCKVSKETLESIINDLVELEKFDVLLWNENKIIWCQDFIDSIQDAYIKRKNKCITYEGLLLHLSSLGVRKQSKSNSKVVINPQRREEKSKEEKRREEKRRKEDTLLTEIEISDLEDFEFEYFEISKAFQNLFIKNLEEKEAPSEKVKKAKFKQFTNPIRLMMQKDKITKDQLTQVFKFLGSPEGDFWKPIILSTEKLRKNFNQLILKSKTPNGNQVRRNLTHEEIVKSAMESEAARNFRFY